MKSTPDTRAARIACAAPATRIARAACAIAARLETVPEVHLYARSNYAENKIFRIHLYLNRYCGNYCMISNEGNPEIIVKKNRA